MFPFKKAILPFGIIFKSDYFSLHYNQIRNYAARKGYREKARKKKIKVEVKKVEFIPHNLREKPSSKNFQSKRLLDDFKSLPEDDVWLARFHKWRVFGFQEAVECHRETHHPEIYNMPKAPLHAFIELNMNGVKKNKYVDPFSRLAKIPHEFNVGQNRTVLVFCKTPELREQAELAGATLVGDVDVVKKIEKGDFMLPDIDYVLAHPNILAEMVCLKGLLKKKFPSAKQGTLGINIGEMVKNYRTGIQYSALRDESELSYGWIDTAIGTLDMDNAELEANFKSLLEDILNVKPKREGPFVTRIMLQCAPSVEKLKINLGHYLPEDFKKDEYESDSDSENTK